MPATQGIPVELAIVPVVGVVLEQLTRAGIQVEELLGTTIDKMSVEQKLVIVKVFISALQQMSSVDYVAPDGRPQLGVLSLMKIMFAHVTVIEGTKAKVIGDGIDAAFTGRNRDMWAVFGFALWENVIKGFLGDALSASPQAEDATT